MSLASCHIGDGTPGLAVHAGDVASTGSAEDAPGYYSGSQSQRWVATGFENMRRYASGLARCVKNRRLPHIAWPRRRSLPSRPVRRRTASIRPRCSAWPATAMHGVPASCQESGRGRHLYVDPDTFTSNESVDQLNARFRRGAVELGKLAVLPTLERVSAMATASRDKPSALPEIFGFRARGFGAPRLHDWHGHRRGSDERLR